MLASALLLVMAVLASLGCLPVVAAGRGGSAQVPISCGSWSSAAATIALPPGGSYRLDSCTWSGAQVLFSVGNDTVLYIDALHVSGSGYLQFAPISGGTALRNFTLYVTDSTITPSTAALVMGADSLDGFTLDLLASTIAATNGPAAAIVPRTASGDFTIRDTTLLCDGTTIYSKWTSAAKPSSPLETATTRGMSLTLDPDRNDVAVLNLTVVVRNNSRVACSGSTAGGPSGCSAAGGLALFGGTHRVHGVLVNVSESQVVVSGYRNTVAVGLLSSGSVFVNVSNLRYVMSGAKAATFVVASDADFAVFGGVLAAGGSRCVVRNVAVEVSAGAGITASVTAGSSVRSAGTVAVFSAMSAGAGTVLDIENISIALESARSVDLTTNGGPNSAVSDVAFMSLHAAPGSALAVSNASVVCDDTAFIVSHPGETTTVTASSILSVMINGAQTATLVGVTIAVVGGSNAAGAVGVSSTSAVATATAMLSLMARDCTAGAVNASAIELRAAGSSTVTATLRRGVQGFAVGAIFAGDANRAATFIAEATLGFFDGSKLEVTASVPPTADVENIVLLGAAVSEETAGPALDRAPLRLERASFRLVGSSRITFGPSAGSANTVTIFGMHSGRSGSLDAAQISFLQRSSEIRLHLASDSSRVTIGGVWSRGHTRLTDLSMVCDEGSTLWFGTSLATLGSQNGPALYGILATVDTHLNVTRAQFSLSHANVTVNVPYLERVAVAGIASPGSVKPVVLEALTFSVTNSHIDVSNDNPQFNSVETIAVIGIAVGEHTSLSLVSAIDFLVTGSNITVLLGRTSRMAVFGVWHTGAVLRNTEMDRVVFNASDSNFRVGTVHEAPIAMNAVAVGGLVTSPAQTTTLHNVHVRVDRCAVIVTIMTSSTFQDVVVFGYAAQVSTATPAAAHMSMTNATFIAAGSNITMALAASTTVNAAVFATCLVASASRVATHNVSSTRFGVVNSTVVVAITGGTAFVTAFGVAVQGSLSTGNYNQLDFGAVRSNLTLAGTGKITGMFSLRASNAADVVLTSSFFGVSRTMVKAVFTGGDLTSLFGVQATDGATVVANATAFLLEDNGVLDVSYSSDAHRQIVLGADVRTSAKLRLEGSAFVLRTGASIAADLGAHQTLALLMHALSVVSDGSELRATNTDFYARDASMILQAVPSTGGPRSGIAAGGAVIYVDPGSSVTQVQSVRWRAINSVVNVTNPGGSFSAQYGFVTFKGALSFVNATTSAVVCNSVVAALAAANSSARLGNITNVESRAVVSGSAEFWRAESDSGAIDPPGFSGGLPTPAARCAFKYPGPHVPTVSGTFDWPLIPTPKVPTPTASSSRGTPTTSHSGNTVSRSPASRSSSATVGTDTRSAGTASGRTASTSIETASLSGLRSRTRTVVVVTPSATVAVTASMHRESRTPTSAASRSTTTSASTSLSTTVSWSREATLSVPLTPTFPVTVSATLEATDSLRRSRTARVSNTAHFPADPVPVSATLADVSDATAGSIATAAAVVNPAVAAQAGRLASLRALAACRTAEDIAPPSVFANPTGLAIASAAPTDAATSGLSDDSRAAVAEHAGSVVANAGLAVGASLAFGVVVAPLRQWFTRRFQGKAKPSVPYALAWARYPAIALFVFEYFTGFIVASGVVVAVTGGSASGVRIGVVSISALFGLGPSVAVVVLFATRFRRNFECVPVMPPTELVRRQLSKFSLGLRWLLVPTYEWQPVSTGDRVALLAGPRRQWLRNFGLAFEGYADRAPWFLVAETLLLNVWTSVALALASTLQCQPAAWIALFTYVLHAVLLVALRPYVVRAEAIGQAISTACQAFSVVASLLVELDIFEANMGLIAEWLATGAAIMVTILALLEFAKVAYLQLRKKWNLAMLRKTGRGLGNTTAGGNNVALLLSGADMDALGAIELTTDAANGSGDNAADRDEAHWAKLHADADRLVNQLYGGGGHRSRAIDHDDVGDGLPLLLRGTGLAPSLRTKPAQAPTSIATERNRHHPQPSLRPAAGNPMVLGSPFAAVALPLADGLSDDVKGDDAFALLDSPDVPPTVDENNAAGSAAAPPGQSTADMLADLLNSAPATPVATHDEAHSEGAHHDDGGGIGCSDTGVASPSSPGASTASSSLRSRSESTSTTSTASPTSTETSVDDIASESDPMPSVAPNCIDDELARLLD